MMVKIENGFMTVEFENGFIAEWTEQEKVIRLYTPDHGFMTSVECKRGTDVSMVAQALMQGFFDGFRHCKHKLRNSVKAAFVNTGIVDIHK